MFGLVPASAVADRATKAANFGPLTVSESAGKNGIPAACHSHCGRPIASTATAARAPATAVVTLGFRSGPGAERRG